MSGYYKKLPKANRVHTHRLLQCLAVGVRPLHVQELAEVLAIDFSVGKGIPKLYENLRWQDQEQAVLTACSSLIDVIDFRNSRMVQFSHYSVKEFLSIGSSCHLHGGFVARPSYSPRAYTYYYG
jgi:hypothetical protein